MKTIIIKSSAANEEQQVKQIETLYLVCNDVQDAVEAQNEGFHICQESIMVKNAFGKGGSFKLQSDTFCQVLAIEDAAFGELEDALQLLCVGDPEREDALNHCRIGVLSQKQEDAIYDLLEPISLASSAEEPIDESKSEEERAFEWLEGLDDVAVVAIAWIELQYDGNIEFAVNALLRAANIGSVRAKNIIHNIIINAKIPRMEKII